MIREIEARTLLGSSREPDPWFGIRYTMNLYRGCQHQCIYCDSRSECYQIEDFNHEVLVKSNALELLEKELKKKRSIGTIGTGSMNDPYMPLEAQINLTGRALQLISRYHFPVHIITKSDLVLRDLPALLEISRVYAAVSFTITTPHDALSRQIEPGAPASSQRFEALRQLSQAGIYTGITLMPILPHITDAEEDLRQLLARAAQAGARYIIPAFSVTLRDRQRAYFYARLDALFPGLRARYEKAYGERYSCPPPNARRLEAICAEECARLGLPTRMQFYQPPAPQQLSLFGP